MTNSSTKKKNLWYNMISMEIKKILLTHFFYNNGTLEKKNKYLSRFCENPLISDLSLLLTK